MSASAPDLALPPGVSVREMTLASATGDVAWWRVVDERGRLLGAGFDRSEAIRLARMELERRGDRG
jgi:alkylated DNA nucleotide flippase Atl1